MRMRERLKPVHTSYIDTNNTSEVYERHQSNRSTNVIAILVQDYAEPQKQAFNPHLQPYRARGRDSELRATPRPIIHLRKLRYHHLSPAGIHSIIGNSIAIPPLCRRDTHQKHHHGHLPDFHKRLGIGASRYSQPPLASISRGSCFFLLKTATEEEEC